MTKDEHLALAEHFNSFAYELCQNTNTLKDNLSSCSDEELIERIVCGRLYYAIYHKLLAYDNQLNTSTSANQHSQLREKVKNTNDDLLIQLFDKLLSLRIWADYSKKSPMPINLSTLCTHTYRIINRQNITI